MRGEPPISGDARLEQLRGELEAWRRTRPKLGPLPGHFWEEAAALARSLEPYRVAKTLHLNYVVLKQRMSALQPASRVRPAASVSSPCRGDGGGFIEVDRVPLPNRLSSEGAVVEMVGVDGARLTIRFQAGCPDVAALFAAFRAQR